MRAVLKHHTEAFSKAEIIVCFYVPAALFCVIAAAFALLSAGRITVQQYYNVYSFAVLCGGAIFFVLAFTNLGVNIVTEVMRKHRQQSVLWFIGLCVFLGLSLPRIFGFI